MIKNLQIIMFITAFAMITFGTTICVAQPRVGGYSETSKTDKTVVEAATFAVETQAQKDDTLELVSIERAERQIVAGSNYRLCLAVKSNGKAEQASTTVYLDLQNEFSLSEWKAGKCAAPKSAEKVTKAATVSKSLAPDVIVKNLYAAQKTKKDAPFFQTTNRAAVDKFFEVDFADLIWNDAVEANGEVGTINFDPLFNSQDQKITAFVIGKPVYTDDIATVNVSFKNFGKAEKIKFILEMQSDKTWKIIDIGYKNGNMLNSMLFDAKLEAEPK